MRRIVLYNNYDSSAYWRERASSPGQAAVLWTNEEYNSLYRSIQREILACHLAGLKPGARILDIGCGVGIVSEMILADRSDVYVDAVDFEEMITVARRKVTHPSLAYYASSAEEFNNGEGVYEAIISSGCYSAIRDIAKLEMALDNGAKMIAPGGLMIMIDPFHRWNYLARAKYNTRDVARFFASRGLTLEKKSGVLFWPFREWLANSQTTGAVLETRFRRGERLLHMLGAHFWADYKVLVFRKTE